MKGIVFYGKQIHGRYEGKRPAAHTLPEGALICEKTSIEGFAVKGTPVRSDNYEPKLEWYNSDFTPVLPVDVPRYAKALLLIAGI